MLTSARLKKFIETHWNVASSNLASDIDAVVAHLKEHPTSDYSAWLMSDLKQAIKAKEFEPEELQQLTDVGFYEQNDADVWVHWMWTSYFPDEPYPVKVPEKKRHSSLTSERLEDFIAAWCDVDGDISEVTESLREYPDGGWALWLKDDLRQAIENREFKPKEIEYLTNIAFDDQADLDKWLHDIWAEWFPGDPYPKQKPV